MNEIHRDFLCTAAAEMCNHSGVGLHWVPVGCLSAIAIVPIPSFDLLPVWPRIESTAVEHAVRRELAASEPGTAGDFRAVLPLGNAVRTR